MTVIMPRGGGSRGGSSRGRSSSPQPPPRQTQAPTKPMPQQTQPQTQAKSGGGFLSGIGSTIMTGMAFGAGSEVAHQAVRSVMGGDSHGKTEQHEQNQQ